VGELHLRLEPVDGPGMHARLPPLAGLPMLRRLETRDSVVCVNWESCHQLTWLHFAGGYVCPDPKAALCFPHLRRLDITGCCHGIVGSDLTKLLRAATALTRLVLHRITFAHNVLPALRGLKCVGGALRMPLVRMACIAVPAARMLFPLCPRPHPRSPATTYTCLLCRQLQLLALLDMPVGDLAPLAQLTALTELHIAGGLAFFVICCNCVCGGGGLGGGAGGRGGGRRCGRGLA
jgi:hypothetical protein